MSVRGLLNFWRDEKGSALLEGTILTPFLFILVFGVVEFSYYFYQQHVVSSGVRDAARYLARVQDPNDPSAQTIAKNLAATGSPTGGADRTTGFDPSNVAIQVVYLDDSALTYNASPAPCSDPAANIYNVCRIQVTGSFAWTPLANLWDFFGFGAKNITVIHSERFIGQG
jgi:Flp pilus assembly protein TadG